LILLDDVLGSGVSENQANRAWVLEDFQIANGATQRFRFNTTAVDVGSGTGYDALGQSVVFEEFVCLIIKQTEGPGQIYLDYGASGTKTYDWMSTTGLQEIGGWMKPGGVRMWYQPQTEALPANTSPPLLTDIEFTLGATGGAAKVSLYILARHDDDESSSSSASSSSQSTKSSSSQSSYSSSSYST